MKKILLPLLLILAVGMLAAVESEPSAIVGYVKYDMLVGNNLVAIPMECPWDFASELGDSFGGSVDQVSYWDATNQLFMTAANLGGFWDGDFTINTGYVLMLNTSATTIMYSIGNLPATNASYNLVTGNNTVMIPLNVNYLAWASEVGDNMTAGGVDQVSYWNNGNQAFFTAANLGGFWDGDFPVSIAMPLMVNAYSPFTWPSAPPAKSHLAPRASK
ncbi:MAG: hypothetical protein PHH97_07155 [Candidatus Cloacimonetes bacterium]|nr:hypothetical protein [Candidatus Cloacimonadota bacterium]MDD4677363.1 hypothetical protein [Candidatus Cloacimonadota bacterium]